MFESIVGSDMALGSYRVGMLQTDKLDKWAKVRENHGGVLLYELERPLRLDIDEQGKCLVYSP
jgi:hypothetical protein